MNKAGLKDTIVEGETIIVEATAIIVIALIVAFAWSQVASV